MPGSARANRPRRIAAALVGAVAAFAGWVAPGAAMVSPIDLAGGLFNAKGLFLPPVYMRPGQERWSGVAIGDLNADGRVDVVATASAYENMPIDPALDHRLFVFLQQADGSLAEQASYPVPGAFASCHPRTVSLGDLNHDGRTDVAVPVQDGVGVFLQNGSGTLEPMTICASGRTSETNVAVIALGDLNHDGLDDIAALDYGTRSGVEVFLQSPDGTLARPVPYEVRHGGYDDLAVADVTGDGRKDLLVMSGQFYDYPSLAVLAQRADGTLGPPSCPDRGGNELAISFAVGDVNADGREDVVLASRASASLLTFLQDAAGQLVTPPRKQDAMYPPRGTLIADVDADGRKDVILASGNVVNVHLQAPDGSLSAPDLSTTGTAWVGLHDSHGLAFGDVNGDGLGDVVLAGGGYCPGVSCTRMTAELTVLYGAAVSVSPPNWATGKTTPGTTSEPRQFTLTNVSDVDLTIGQIGLVHASGQSLRFQLRNDHCSDVALATRESCTVEVVFAPAAGETQVFYTDLEIPFAGRGVAYVHRRPLRGNE